MATTGTATKRTPRGVSKTPRAPKTNGAAVPEPTEAPPAPSYEAIGKMKIAAGITRYLEECQTLGTRPRGQKPMAARKPETIRKSIAKHEAKAETAPTLIAQLKERSLIIDLRRALDAQGAGEISDARAFFITYAGEWALKNGVSYAAFREMGVTAGVLKAAGIQP